MPASNALLAPEASETETAEPAAPSTGEVPAQEAGETETAEPTSPAVSPPHFADHDSVPPKP